MDIATVLKAISIVGDFTPAAIELYEGFIAVLKGDDQEDLKQRYATAKTRSDELHGRVQSAMDGPPPK